MTISMQVFCIRQSSAKFMPNVKTQGDLECIPASRVVHPGRHAKPTQNTHYGKPKAKNSPNCMLSDCWREPTRLVEIMQTLPARSGGGLWTPNPTGTKQRQSYSQRYRSALCSLLFVNLSICLFLFETPTVFTGVLEERMGEIFTALGLSTSDWPNPVNS